MEFNSPQPEQAQLHGHIHSKGATMLLNMLHQQVQAELNKGGSGSHGELSGHRGAKGESQMRSDGVSGVPVIGDGGIYIEGSGSIDLTLDENNLIPSPPLSPKVYQGEIGASLSHDAVSLDRVGMQKNTNLRGLDDAEQVSAGCGEIVVTPSWTTGMTTKRYRYATHGFLSQYRLMGYGNGGLTRPKRQPASSSSVVARRSAKYSKTYASGSDFDKVYRTRRVTKNAVNAAGEIEDMSSVPVPSRPSPRANRKPKKSHIHHGQHQLHSSPLASAKEVHSAPTYVPNMSWEKLPDYSPPLSTLPSNNNNKCLKVEWKGSSMDLSNDPLKHKLHPAELVLAQTLRLPCDLYLDSKRRLFCEKVHRLKQDMPFRRTDAQKACRIDVNKASRLFAAYEKIGWLDDDNFAKYL
ncbi:uncharacterized protein Ecym_5055 [Eremothecium cymbalariae DBVPG|uniref:SWIRM domain-containing protein n=1 Tax=Eremothecium cymbalariae (strain CBS 270.75 / DBVPG 7215 / KCTC 17166 / NRRL Y-17582) TaxID=931890 RepID=I6NCQ4_ERECY|nr:hypothetical protein Ecym_5055 [Eremothecium cymbalariae DBVPG\